ncbi:MAG: hypothetical protein GX248_06740 [Peptococcaceae bacterium]|nr:hypothetical protein [Peptococcaceae bacterium]
MALSTLLKSYEFLVRKASFYCQLWHIIYTFQFCEFSADFFSKCFGCLQIFPVRPAGSNLIGIGMFANKRTARYSDKTMIFKD